MPSILAQVAGDRMETCSTCWWRVTPSPFGPAQEEKVAFAPGEYSAASALLASTGVPVPLPSAGVATAKVSYRLDQSYCGATRYFGWLVPLLSSPPRYDHTVSASPRPVKQSGEVSSRVAVSRIALQARYVPVVRFCVS